MTAGDVHEDDDDALLRADAAPDVRDDDPDRDAVPGDGRDETPAERRDRQLDELLQELRVMQTGVQVLFAFLLSVPFTQRFDRLDADQELLYFLTLLSSGTAVLFLLAPSAWHRILFSRGDKAHIVLMSHRFAMAGLVFIALSIVGVIALIATVLYPGGPAVVVTAGAVVVFVVLWAVAPLMRRARIRDRSAEVQARSRR